MGRRAYLAYPDRRGASGAPQLEALDLAGGRLRQLGDELDPARVLVRREQRSSRAAAALRRVARRCPGFSTTKALGLMSSSSSATPMTAASSTAACVDERGLDLERRDVDAARPSACRRCGRRRCSSRRRRRVYLSPLRVHAPVKRAPGSCRGCSSTRSQRVGPLICSSPISPARDWLAVVADDAQLVAGHRLAGGAVAHVAGPVGQEDVQHLGRADAVEDVDAEVLASSACRCPPAAPRRRERSMRRFSSLARRADPGPASSAANSVGTP